MAVSVAIRGPWPGRARFLRGPHLLRPPCHRGPARESRPPPATTGSSLEHRRAFDLTPAGGLGLASRFDTPSSFPPRARWPADALPGSSVRRSPPSRLLIIQAQLRCRLLTRQGQAFHAFIHCLPRRSWFIQLCQPLGDTDEQNGHGTPEWRHRPSSPTSASL